MGWKLLFLERRQAGKFTWALVMRLAAAIIQAWQLPSSKPGSREKLAGQASLAVGAVAMAEHTPKNLPKFSAATLPCPGVSQLCSNALCSAPLCPGNNTFLMCLKQQPKCQAFLGIAFQQNPCTLTKGQSKMTVLFLQTPTEIPAHSGCWRQEQVGWCHV